MPDKYTQQSPSPEPTNLLQSRPQRRSRRGLAILLLLLGSVIIGGVMAIVTRQALSHYTPPTRSGIPTKDNANGNSVPPGWNDPAIYWQTIRAQVAQGLHLSIAQITTQLQTSGATNTVVPISTDKKKSAAPDPGASMANLAAQQGLSTNQLHVLELSALQQGCAAMVAQGKLLQIEATQRMQMFEGWDQNTLNWYVIHAFTGQ